MLGKKKYANRLVNKSSLCTTGLETQPLYHGVRNNSISRTEKPIEYCAKSSRNQTTQCENPEKSKFQRNRFSSGPAFEDWWSLPEVNWLQPRFQRNWRLLPP